MSACFFAVCAALLTYQTASAAPTSTSMYAMCTGDGNKYYCTHDRGSYRSNFKCINIEASVSTLTTTTHGVAPTCHSGEQACCCDPDGDCNDGSDDWCCPNSLPAQHKRGQCIESESMPHFCSHDDFMKSARMQCMTIKTATATTTNQQPVCPDTLTPACCCDIDDDCSDGDDDWCCPAAGHCVAKDSDCKYICTHDEDLEAHPLHDNGGADSDGGAGNNGAKQQSRRPRCSAEFTQQGEAPTCTNGADALCCDIDGSCLDGDDDWCCAVSNEEQEQLTTVTVTSGEIKVQTLTLRYLDGRDYSSANRNNNNSLLVLD